MTRADHIVKRFHSTMGDSWWWRRKADLIDRKQDDGYKPFDYNAHKLVMSKRNRERFKNQVAMGLPIEVKQPYRIKPVDLANVPMVDRPEGMTRQTQRRLYREACKVAGVDFHPARKEKTPRRLRGMTAVQRALYEEEQWQKFKAEHVRITFGPEEVAELSALGFEKPEEP